jgi:predicted acyltransferase
MEPALTTTTAPPPACVTPGKASAERLISLDVFRGATIAAMILVNDPGNGPTAYWPLQHSKWNGWTPTDLVFPFFLFIVGVAMAFSFRSRRGRGESQQKLVAHVLWRALALFALGMLLNGFPNHYHLGSWRIYGVLQRIAVCYVVVALLALWTNWRTHAAVIAGCLAGYWILMRYVPVPGFGVPGHDIPLLDPDRNLVAWLDRKLLWGHLYEVTRDPEGLLSTIPAVATALIGLLSGEWLRSKHEAMKKSAAMAGIGVVCAAAGEILNLWFPINKKLWTSSYVLFTAGLALITLAVCYWILDVEKWRVRWSKPLLVLGRNAIAAYVLSEMVAATLDSLQLRLADGVLVTWHDVLYENLFAPVASPPNASLLYALVYVLFCWAVMWALYRKGIFLKV